MAQLVHVGRNLWKSATKAIAIKTRKTIVEVEGSKFIINKIAKIAVWAIERLVKKLTFDSSRLI